MATKKSKPAKKSQKLPTVKDIARAAHAEGLEAVFRFDQPAPKNEFIGVPVTVTFKDKESEDLRGQFPKEGGFWFGRFMTFETGGGKVLLNADSIDQVWLDAPEATPVETPPEPQDPVGVDV